METPGRRRSFPASDIQRADGDARFISVTEDFMRSWLIEKDIVAQRGNFEATVNRELGVTAKSEQ